MVRILPQTFLIVAAVCLSGCESLPTSIESPRLSLANVGMQSVNLMEQRFRLTLRVENPNSFSVPIKGLSYAVRLAGSDFASGTAPNAFSVPASGESLVDIDVSTNLLQTARQLMTFLSSKPEAIDYALSGEVAIDLPFINPIPFSTAGQVAVSTLIN